MRITVDEKGRYKLKTFNVTLAASEPMPEKLLLSSPRSVATAARDLINQTLDAEHEHFLAFFLNIRNEVIGHKVFNSGTVDQVAVYPRSIIKAALLIGAAGLILAHNHPSGYVEPSEEDKSLTFKVKEAGRLLDIRILDHLVVGASGQYSSFAEKGLL